MATRCSRVRVVLLSLPLGVSLATAAHAQVAAPAAPPPPPAPAVNGAVVDPRRARLVTPCAAAPGSAAPPATVLARRTPNAGVQLRSGPRGARLPRQ